MAQAWRLVRNAGSRGAVSCSRSSCTADRGAAQLERFVASGLQYRPAGGSVTSNSGPHTTVESAFLAPLPAGNTEERRIIQRQILFLPPPFYIQEELGLWMIVLNVGSGYKL